MANSPYGLTSVEYNGLRLQNLESRNTKEIVRGSFTSPDAYLGIFFIPFQNKKPLPEVPVELRLYEKISRKLVHKHIYTAKNFSDKPFFPFGIPTVVRSQGVEYEFSIQTTEESPYLNGLSLDRYHTVNTVHLFDRRELRRDNIMQFLIHKTAMCFVLLTPTPFVIIFMGSIIFPFLLWILSKFGIVDTIISQTKYTWLLGNTLLIAVLILIPRNINDAIYVFWAFLYIVASLFFRRPTKSHYLWALLLLLLCPLFLTFSDELRAEKSGIIAFLLLVVGVGQELISVFRSATIHNETS
jgi:hypothetical protein